MNADSVRGRSLPNASGGKIISRLDPYTRTRVD